MQVKFYNHGLDLKQETREYILPKVQKMQKYISNNNTQAQVEIQENKKGIYTVEVQIQFPGNRYLARETGKEIEEAADLALDDLKAQIIKDKNKRRTLQKRGAISIKKKLSIDENARF
ncbi:MAG: hypothetical protein GF332_04265 [Candidatus Moranbacteria bacterium]|nr:hypothetical protein [Candidatus Moranbacteria bacterium]